jgi:hypothetical protein
MGIFSNTQTGVNLSAAQPVDLRENASNAIRFWERWRILYNLVLTVVVIVHFIAAYPASKQVLSINFCLALFLLAVVANILYCTAYLPDIFVQASGFHELWQNFRWLLLVVGTTCAAIITHFVSTAMFSRA